MQKFGEARKAAVMVPHGSPEEQRRQLHQACAELERRLRGGHHCRAEELLETFPAVASHAELALELVYTEFVLRAQLGQKPSPDEWYARFPQWRADLEELFQVHQLVYHNARGDTTGVHVPAPGSRVELPPLPHKESDLAAAPQRIGRYQLLAEIGRGGMGIVYQARDLMLGRSVALKMVRSAERAEPAELLRFLAEAQAIAALQHPHIVPVFEIGEHDGLPYFTLEFAVGGSLAGRLGGQPQTAADSARLVEQMARAMHYAHEKGIVHRDLKPANILLVEESTTPLACCTAKVSDFGLVKFGQGIGMTQSGAVMGTPSYMAPEQAASKGKEIGPAADVYALGGVLYEMLTGRPPFRSATAMETMVQVVNDEPVSPRQLQSRVPVDLETICLKCLQKEPRRRYSNAAALANDLRRFQEGRPIQARPLGSVARLGRWCRRKPAIASLIGLLIAVTLLGFSLVTWKWLEAVEERQQAVREGKEARRQTARQWLERALGAGEQGEIDKTLFWLARGVAEAEKAGDDDLERTLRRQLAAWAQSVCRLRGFLPEGRMSFLALSSDGKTLLTGKGREFLSIEELTRLPRGSNRLKGLVQVWDVETLAPRGEPLLLRGDVLGVAFSPDGRTFLTHCQEEIALWDRTSGQLRTVLKPMMKPAAAAFSPDGQFVLTGFEKGARFWKAATGEPASAVLPQRGLVNRVAFSPDGTHAATVSEISPTSLAAEVQLWKVPSFQPTGRRLDHPKGVTCLAFNARTQQLWTGCADGATRVWRVDTGAQVRSITSYAVRTLALNRAGTRMVIGTRRGTYTLHVSGNVLYVPPRDVNGVRTVAVSPDQEFIATAGGAASSQMGEVLLLSVGLQHFRASPLRHAAPVREVAFAVDGGSLVTLDTQGTVALWQIPGPTPIGSAEGSPASPAKFFSPSGRLALIGRQLWDTATGQPHGPPLAHPDLPVQAVFTSDERLVAVVGETPEITIWDTRPDRPAAVRLKHPGGTQPSRDLRIRALAISPDGRLLATGNTDGRAQLWHLETGEPAGPVWQHCDDISMILFSADSRLLLADRPAGEWKPGTIGVQVWDFTTGKPRVLLKPEGGPGLAVFTRDSQSILIGTHNGAVQRWDIASGKPVGPVLQHQALVTEMVCSRDGKVLATASVDRTARIWEIETGRAVGPALQHRHFVNAVALSSDARLALTGCQDGTAQLWDLRLGRPLGAPRVHPSGVSTVALTADGRHLLVGCDGGIVRRYDVPTPAEGTTTELVRGIQILTGVELDEHDQLRVVTPAARQEVRTDR